MSVFERFSNLFRKEKDSEAQYSTVTGGKPGNLESSLVHSKEERNFDTFIKAYSAIPEIYYAARLPARLIANQQVEVSNSLRIPANTNQVKKGGDLFNLIDNPHPVHTFSELIYRIWLLKKVFGYAILAREVLPEGTYWTVLNPKHCILVADPKTKFMAVQYHIGDTKLYYMASDFILFEEFSMVDFYYGLSSISVGSLDTQLLMYGKRSTTNNYKLGDPPQIALRVRGVGPEEVEKIKKEMKERTPEDGRFLIFSEQHFEVHDTSPKGGKNTTGLDASKYGANNTSLTMDVPPALLSDTTKEFRESLEFLYITTVIPGIKEIQEKINHFAKLNKLSQRITFLYRKDLIVARILLDLGKTLASLISSGVMTINEAREYLDLDTLPTFEDTERDFSKIDFGNIPIPVFDAMIGAQNKTKINENGTAPGSVGGRNKTD